jgi:hypothetical protein
MQREYAQRTLEYRKDVGLLPRGHYADDYLQWLEKSALTWQPAAEK